MALEIERKFLVNKRAWKKVRGDITEREEFIQGYLTRNGTHSSRIRIATRNVGKRDVHEYAKLTIKGKPRGITRDEFEYDIPVDDARQMMKLCDGIINKTRFFVREDIDGEVNEWKLWTVDEFKGLNKGLVLAEIELENEDEHFEIPEWIDREVTHNKQFNNNYLSKHKVDYK